MKFPIPKIWRESEDHSVTATFALWIRVKDLEEKMLNISWISWPWIFFCSNYIRREANSTWVNEKIMKWTLGVDLQSIRVICAYGITEQMLTMHYIQRSRPVRTELCVGKRIVKFEPIVEAWEVLLPPLHIKLGLMKLFV